jgi:predicted nucleic acid-binding protein
LARRVSGSLLDTSVLIARDETGALELPDTAAISVITVGELRAGVLIARDETVAEERRRRLAAVRAAFAPLPVDEPVAERYGDVLAMARCSQGRAAKATDLLIIATAAATGRELYTLDTAQARLAQAAGVAATVP